MSLSEAPAKHRRMTSGSLYGLSVGLIALLIAVVAGVIWYERQQTIEQAERNARNLTEVLAAQTRENFHAIDQALLAIVERLQVDRLAEDSQIEPSYRLLFDSFRTVPNGVLTYFILDEDGRLLNSSRTPDRE